MNEPVKAKIPAILFVDHAPGIAHEIRSPECAAILQQTGVVALHARNRREAQLIMSEETHELRFVAVNPELPEDGLSSIVNFTKTKHMELPVFALDGTAASDGELLPAFKALGVRGWLKRPLSGAILKAAINATLKGFHSSLTDDAAKKDQAKVGDEIVTDESAMVSIAATSLIIGAKSYFDVYLRLGPGRFVKLIKAGDIATADQVSKYVSRGVDLFFIRKDLQEAYVKYCEQAASVLLGNKGVAMDTKANRVLSQGREAFNLIRTQGVSEDSLKYAGNFVLNVGKVVKDYNLVSNDTISRFLARVSSYEHNTRVATMSGMLALALKLDSEKSAHIIGMAGLLHDVGLMRLGLDESIGERESQLTPEERTVYETHPKVGADTLAALRRFDPTVIQAVAQHHFRKNGTGFPDRTTFTHIHICAEIVGIVDEYDYLLTRAKVDPTVDLKYELQRIYSGFSRNVVVGFQKAFLTQESEQMMARSL